MKIITRIGSLAGCLFLAVLIAAGKTNSHFTSLLDIDQNQAFESKSQIPSLFLQASGSVRNLPKLAKVHFIISSNDKIGFEQNDPQFNLDNLQKCKDLGFKTEAASCTAAGQNSGQACPYETSLTDICCDKSYKFRRSDCFYPKTISSDSCNGKYRCYCDTTLYPYSENSCPAPKIHNNDKCAEDGAVFYSGCICPSNWRSCDAKLNLTGNGLSCNENGDNKYESCICKAGYSLTCDDYGPSSPLDYCFINGTKYYKSCNDIRKYCNNKGYEYSADNPCPENQVPKTYCPVKGGDAFYTCSVDPDTYCKNNGFSSQGCLPYEIESSEKCPYDTAGIYRKCTKTCISRLVNEEGMAVLVKDTLLYNKNTAVVLANVNDMPTMDPVKVNEFTTINGYTAYADKYPECVCQNKKTKSIGDPYFFNVNGSFEKYNTLDYCENPMVVASRSNGLLNRNLSNLHIRIDHEQATSLNYLNVDRAVTWNNLYIDNQNWSYKSPTTGNINNYGTINCYQLWYRNDGTVIRINGQLDMKGKIYIESPTSLSRVMLSCNNTQANKLPLITIDVPGKLNIAGNGIVRDTEVVLKDVNIYEGNTNNPNSPSHIQLYGKAYLWVSGGGIHIANGDFGIEDSSFVSTTYLGMLNNGGAGTYRWIMAVKNSFLYSDFEVQLQDGGLMIKGGSEYYVRSGDGTLARNSVVCVHGGYLANTYRGGTLWAGSKSPYGGCASANCCNESSGQRYKVASYAPYYYNSLVTDNSRVCSNKAATLP